MRDHHGGAAGGEWEVARMGAMRRVKAASNGVSAYTLLPPTLASVSLRSGVGDVFLSAFKMKSAPKRIICNPMFFAAEFTIAKTQNQPRCPSPDGWIKKRMWHIHMVE